jgi:hypothetical protein
MQQPSKLYLVLSYILIPIALFFGFMDSILLISALANPSAMILVFALDQSQCLCEFIDVLFDLFECGEHIAFK